MNSALELHFPKLFEQGTGDIFKFNNGRMHLMLFKTYTYCLLLKQNKKKPLMLKKKKRRFHKLVVSVTYQRGINLCSKMPNVQ